MLGPAFSASVAQASSCRVVFDGVLYDRGTLDRDLPVGEGPDDATLVLHAYLVHGEDVFRVLRGVFSLVIWDGRHDLLLAARDPMGIYPLFHAQADGRLLFSTSIDALIRLPHVSASVSRVMLADHLRHLMADPEETYFEAVRRVPAGHVMRVKRGSQLVHRYWDPTRRDGSVEWLDETAVGQFGDVLDRAVGRQLDIGKGGIFLSGGLDSVSVAATAADNRRRQGITPPLALSLAFPHPDCNEEETQRAVAGQLQLPQVLLSMDEAVGTDGLLAANLEMNRDWPFPVLNFWLPAYRRLAAEARERGCRVILTGSGGDEWLTLGPLYGADLLRQLRLGGYLRFWRVLGRSYRLSTFELMRSMWKYGPRVLLGASARRLVGAVAPGALKNRQLRLYQRSIPDWAVPDPALRRDIAHRVDPRPQQLSPGPLGYYRDQLRRPLDHPIVALEMEERFEAGRREGVIELHPFWDPEVQDLLYRTPPEMLIMGGRSKGLVRHLMAERFPELNFERQRKVVSIDYFRSTVLQGGRRAWRSVGGVPALDALGVVDAGKARSLIEGVLARHDMRQAHRIWEILQLEVWARART